MTSEAAPPSLQANSPIAVEEVTVTAIDGQPVQMPVRVVLRLAPSPGLVLEYDAFPLCLIDRAAKSRTLLLDNGGELEVLNPTPLPGPKGLRGVLHPTRQPLTVLDAGQPLQGVTFDVVNFLHLYGNHDKWTEVDGTGVRCGTARMQIPPFRVTISANNDLSENQKVLSETGGYAITHTGHLRRVGGRGFSSTEAEDVLTAVRSFLSFARGAACGLASVEGIASNGDVSWVKWGSHGVARWQVVHSWVQNLANGMDVLADAFPGFWSVFRADAAKADQAIEFAMHWYVCSNEAKAVTASLLLSQAALERLAFKELGPRRKLGKKKKKEEEKTGVWIGRALCRAGVGHGIPAEYRHLAAAGLRHNWASGPHAITATRNDLVHPRMKSPVATEVLIDAWNLSQWYVELLLLKRFGYGGSYRNRMSNEWGLYGVVASRS